MYSKKFNLIIEAIFIITSIVLFYFFLINKISSPTVDLASHYSLVYKIQKDFYINIGYIANLGEMSNYPPFAHYVSAIMAILLGQTILGINSICILSVYIFYYIVFKNIYIYGALSILTMVFILSLSNFPIVGREVVGGNFLFPQLVSIAYLVLSLYFYNKIDNLKILKKYVYALLIFTGALFIHPSMAVVYFTFFTINLSLIYKNKILNKDLMILCGIILFIFLGAFIFKYHPYTQFSQDIKNHNGSLGFSRLNIDPLMMSVNAYVLILISIVYSFFYIIKHISKENIIITNDIKTYINLIFISFTIISSIQLILFHFNIVSAYVVKKNFFGLFTSLSLIISIWISGNIKIKNIDKYINKNLIIHLASVSVCFILFYKSSFTNEKLEPYVASVKKLYNLTKNSDAFRNTITHFNLPMPINWLLSTGELEIYKWGPLSHDIVHGLQNELPNTSYVFTDDNTIKLLPVLNVDGFKLYRSSDFNSPRDAFFNVNLIDNKKIDYNVKNILYKGFSESSDWGYWTVGTESIIQFKIPYKRKNSKYKIIINLRGFILGKHTNSQALININSVLEQKIVLNTNNFQEYQFIINYNSISEDRNIFIKIKNLNPIMPKDLIESNDDRLINLGVNYLSIEMVE